MVAKWIEQLTGSLEQKQYRDYRARSAALPEPYAMTVRAIERYLTYYGAIADGEVLVRMLTDLVELAEQGAADGTSVRVLVGEDPVEFAETFLANYADGQWIKTERARLVAAIEQAAGAQEAGR